MNDVIIINGYPQSGKDTFVEMFSKIAKENKTTTINYSSIDCIVDLCKSIPDLKFERHDLKARTLLAEMGQALEKYNDYRTNKCLEFILDSSTNSFLFVHMREPELIDKLKNKLENNKQSVITLLISRELAVKNIPNKADSDEILNYNYDHIIYNNGTLEDLNHKVKNFYRIFYNYMLYSSSGEEVP